MASVKKSDQQKPEVTNDEDIVVESTADAENARQICGIIMPLSAIDNCSEAHWSDVREILSDAIDAAGFDAQLVSDADDVGIIQKRIIQNVYENPLVVCDVSGKNPNVMFELGMRLAFDKPTVIVKDDKTAYSFDTAPIEHLQYPRDLRFGQIVDFKKSLAIKLRATHKKATEDKQYTTFLKHFGSFTVAKLDTKTVSTEDFILEEMRSLRQLVARIGSKSSSEESRIRVGRRSTLCVRSPSVTEEEFSKVIASLVGEDVDVEKTHAGHLHAVITGGAMSLKELVGACARYGGEVKILPEKR